MQTLHTRELKGCLISGKPVVDILHLGQHSFADSFIPENMLHITEPVIPLELTLCPISGQIQLKYISSAYERYNMYDYSYTSGNSPYSRNHWVEFASYVKNKYPNRNFVVEIGSNDGYLLQLFSDSRTLGVDSSKEMCALAQDIGVNTKYALFSNVLVSELLETHGKADVIIANNVFNHANDPLEFAQAVSRLLTDDGVFIFEVPYWFSMVEAPRFCDMVYHEHVSYFTAKSCYNLMKQAGLEIVNFDVVDYHGGSLRIEAKLAKGREIDRYVQGAILKETKAGLFSPFFYKKYEHALVKARNCWLEKFCGMLGEDPDAVVIGIGAAAKANTWLNWHRLDNTLIKYITDSSPAKQGKYTPLTRIPIVDDSIFSKYERPVALVLSWNIGETLKEKILAINPNTRFITQ